MAIQNIIDQALSMIRGPAPLRPVYKRLTVSGGGNALLGIGQTLTYTDTLLNPQPAYSQLNQKASVLSSSDRVLQASDYEFTLSGSSISIDELEADNLSLVFKGPGTVVEELSLIGYDPSEYQGVNVAYTIYARSKSRA